MAERGIYLIGSSGAGKSTIAKLVGERLGWPVYDLDAMIVEESGMSIPTIFEREGEVGFRLRESAVLQSVSERGPFVVATGGGAPVRPENRRIMARTGWTITLEGRPETLNARIQEQLRRATPDAVRPMLASNDPLEQLRALKHTRQAIYALADWTIHTDRLTFEQVADEIIRAVEILNKAPAVEAAFDVAASPLAYLLGAGKQAPIVVPATPWPYQVVVGWQNLAGLAPQMRRLLPRGRKLAVLSDAQTWQRIGPSLEASLTEQGFAVHVRLLSDDEQSKNLASVGEIYDWLYEADFGRDDLIVAAGGSVIDDLAGFVASTYMRGLPLIKLPTSLETMLDSAVGGKNALNHRKAHNILGSFYHPRLVWIDASLVEQEEPRQLRAAWAELVKYAMLERSLLPGEALQGLFFDYLEEHVEQLLQLDQACLLHVIRYCVALKAQVVAADERDLGQFRMLLNYGHTLGHALQAASDYTILHGEAVALGMALEANLAVRTGRASQQVEQRQNALLKRFGLSLQLGQIDRDRLLALIERDKKRSAEAARWILPLEIGKVAVLSNLSRDDLLASLAELSAS